MNRKWQVQIHLGLLIIFTELNGKNTHSFYNSKLHTCIFDIYDSYGSCYISKSSDFPLILETSSMVKRATLTCPLTMRRNRAKNFQAYLSLSQYLKCFKINIIWLTWKSLFFQPDSNAGLSEAIHLDMLNRAKLREIYDKILGLYNTLPVQYQKSLNSAYPDLVNYLTAKRKDLDSSDIVILVAGIY